MKPFPRLSIVKPMLSNLLRAVCLGIITCSLVLGCGVKPAEQASSNSATDKSLSLVGTFTDTNNAPIAGLEVELINTGAKCTSDSEGVCQLSSAAISGDAELEITLSNSKIAIRLESITSQSSTVDFQVRVDQSQQMAELTSLTHNQPEPEVEPTPAQEDLAPSSTPSEKPTTSPTSKPTAKPTPKATPKPTPKPKPPSKCTRCHGDRGNPRCSSKSWVKIHKSVYKCSSKSLDFSQLSSDEFMFELAQELEALNSDQ